MCQDQIRVLTDSVTAWAKQRQQPNALLGIDAALAKRQQGETNHDQGPKEESLPRVLGFLCVFGYLGPRAHLLPAVADGIFIPVPGSCMTRLPVVPGIRLQ